MYICLRCHDGIIVIAERRLIISGPDKQSSFRTLNLGIFPNGQWEFTFVSMSLPLEISQFNLC